jgi:hypothetical protein
MKKKFRGLATIFMVVVVFSSMVAVSATPASAQCQDPACNRRAELGLTGPSAASAPQKWFGGPNLGGAGTVNANTIMSVPGQFGLKVQTSSGVNYYYAELARTETGWQAQATWSGESQISGACVTGNFCDVIKNAPRQAELNLAAEAARARALLTGFWR